MLSMMRFKFAILIDNYSKEYAVVSIKKQSIKILHRFCCKYQIHNINTVPQLFYCLIAFSISDLFVNHIVFKYFVDELFNGYIRIKTKVSGTSYEQDYTILTILYSYKRYSCNSTTYKGIIILLLRSLYPYSIVSTMTTTTTKTTHFIAF